MIFFYANLKTFTGTNCKIKKFISCISRTFIYHYMYVFKALNFHQFVYCVKLAGIQHFRKWFSRLFRHLYANFTDTILKSHHSYSIVYISKGIITFEFLSNNNNNNWFKTSRICLLFFSLRVYLTLTSNASF